MELNLVTAPVRTPLKVRRVVDNGDKLRLMELGFTPHVPCTILSQDECGVIVMIWGSRVALNNRLAANIYVDEE